MPIYRNWEDAKDYEFTRKLDLQGWAWEFLRRNPNYQEDWERSLKEYEQKTGMRWSSMDEIEKFFILLGPSKVCDKWAVSGLIDPLRDNYFPMTFIGANCGTIRFSEAYEKYNRSPFDEDDIFYYEPLTIPEGFASVLFDLNLKIEPQLSNILNHYCPNVSRIKSTGCRALTLDLGLLNL